MVRIRLQRVGAKRQPTYRIVAIDSRSPRSGRAIEILGSYNPRTEPETVAIKGDRALYWLSQGAQPSAATKRLLVKQGVWAQFTQLKQGDVAGTSADDALEDEDVLEDETTLEDEDAAEEEEKESAS
jgi:small subunit ribosomal protein S16